MRDNSAVLRKAVLAALASLIVAALQAKAQYSYMTLEYPLPGNTQSFQGIDGTNIVGYYEDTDLHVHGFLYNGTSYTPLDDPSADGFSADLGTWATGISGGNITGYYSGNDLTATGFLYSGGAWTDLVEPQAGFGASQGTYPQGIAGSVVVGYYTDIGRNYHGFSYSGGGWTTLDHPLAASGPYGGTYAYGVSGSNIVGYYGDANGAKHGFIYSGGAWSTLDDPLGAGGTFAYGISGASIVGEYIDSQDLSHGFLYNGSAWTTVDGPAPGLYYPTGPYATAVSGSNILGNCAGAAPPDDGVFYYSHGFLYNGSAYQTLDEPLALFPAITSVTGVDSTNVLGFFQLGDYISSGFGGAPPTHGFLYNGRTWAALDAPNVAEYLGGNVPAGTFPQALWGSNIVGYYFQTNGVDTNLQASDFFDPYVFGACGFLFNGGNWTNLIAPSAGPGQSLVAGFAQGVQGTYAESISGAGIVGYYIDTNFLAHGFLYNAGNWTTLDDPFGAGGTFIYGIWCTNIVGAYIGSNGVEHGFLYSAGSWTTLDDPLAGSGPGQGTVARGICGTNIAGFYLDTNGVRHGFLYNGATWTTLDEPLAEQGGTYVLGISGAIIYGQFAYVAETGALRQPGFLAAPPPCLSICMSGGGLEISWPYTPLPWTLQVNPDLNTTNWASIAGVVEDGTVSSVTITPPAGSLFFRLSQQP